MQGRSSRRRPGVTAVTGLVLAGCLSTLSLAHRADMAAIDPRTLPIRTDLARQLRAHVDFLASPGLRGRQPGTEGNRAAAAYVEARFREFGLRPLDSLGGHRHTLTGALGDNVVGWRPAAGAGAAAPWLLLGAHFDHLGDGYLGADDNASAVAILLETARRLPPLPHHHVLFVAFNAEEPPYIRTPQMGSRQFVDRLPAEIGDPRRFQAVVIMDLMGGLHWAPIRDTIFAAGAEQSPGLYRRLTEAAGTLTDERGTMNAERKNPPFITHHSALSIRPLGLHLIEEIPLVGRTVVSDYDAFRNAAAPFLFLSSGRTPRYHQPTDLPDTLHYERMAATVGWLRGLLASLDQDREPYVFDAARVEVADEVATLRFLLRQAVDPETAIPGTSALSRWKLKRDEEWLQRLDVTAATPHDLERLERLSIRLQCLLADFPGCFLL